ncbi:uncharacterized protein LOC114530711 [Dendronephthya gigantea]|uniref:uncharacterized protein LOC114530711 n=1 Tax=Dendronephthya gigantea TaxID=151771 RepID=UPI00106A4F4D|nr:uncharacterized protein LOC114530711 [Dendronephthya gigantea]
MVMSFSRDNLEHPAYNQTLRKNFPVSENAPNFIKYRLSYRRMVGIRDHSKYWRYSCMYDELALKTTIRFKAPFVSLNPLVFDSGKSKGNCSENISIKIKDGKKCSHCNVPVVQRDGLLHVTAEKMLLCDNDWTKVPRLLGCLIYWTLRIARLRVKIGMDSDRFREDTLKRLERLEHILEEIKDNTKATPNEIWHVPREDKVIISVRAKFQTVGDIDNVNQQFYAYFVLTLTWKEPRLKGMKREDVVWSEQWDPRINFKNQLTVDRLEKHHELRYEPGDDIPTVYMYVYAAGIFKEILELSDFPFDYQSLSVQIESDWPDNIMSFEKNNEIKDSVILQTFAGCHEWSLCPHVVAGRVDPKKNNSGSHRTYPNYEITCHVKRKPNFYMWNVALIMGLIMSLTFCSFSVDVDSPEDRLSVTLTLLLTSVAFKFVVSQSLPNVSYLTCLDQYVISCMIIQCIIAVLNAIGGKIPEENQELFDNASVCVLGGSVVILHFIFGIIFSIKVAKRNTFLSKITKEYDRLAAEYNERWNQKKKHLKSQEQQDEGNKTPRSKKREKNKRQVEDINMALERGQTK